MARSEIEDQNVVLDVLARIASYIGATSREEKSVKWSEAAWDVLNFSQALTKRNGIEYTGSIDEKTCELHVSLKKGKTRIECNFRIPKLTQGSM